MKKLLPLLIAILLAVTFAFSVSASESDAPGFLKSETREVLNQEIREDFDREIFRREIREKDANEEPEAGYAELMADGTASVSVTVNLPSGVTANEGDYCYAYLYKPAETDASGRLIAIPYFVKSKRVDFTAGANTATASFENIPDGNYILNMYIRGITGGKVLNDDIYYNADGSQASSEYAASSFHVADGANISKVITLPKAETSISGNLTFSNPLSQDTEFEIWADSSAAYDNESYYLYFTGKQGATSVPFSIGVISGVYEIGFYKNDSYYLNYDGELEKFNYRKNYYCGVSSGSAVSGLSIDGDILLSQGDTNVEENVKVEISVTLPEAVKQESKYSIIAAYDHGDYISYNSSTVTIPAGSATISRTLTLVKGREYALGYRDGTGLSSYYSFTEEQDVRFTTDDGGVTTLFENAKKFTFTEDRSVQIQKPDFCRVTGSVNRNGFNAGVPVAAYAYALFPDGERYCGLVQMGAADSAEYIIYIPRTYIGQQFQLSAAVTRESSSNHALKSSVGDPISVTLNGDINNQNLTISGDYITASGSLSLPDGATAPTGGQAVRFQADDETAAYYIIPAGENHISFSFHAYPRNDYSSASLYAYLEGGLSGVFPEVSQYKYFDEDSEDSERADWYSDRTIQFAASAVISGSISFTPNTNDVGATMELYASVNGGEDSSRTYSYQYISILKGRNSADYVFTVPVAKLSNFDLNMYGSTDGRAADDNIYIDENWNAVTDWKSGPTVTGDRSGVNFTIQVFGSGVSPAIQSVYSQYENEEGDLLDNLREYGYFHAVCVGSGGAEASVIAAIYDQNGRLLDADTWTYVSLSRSGQSVYFRFDSEKLADMASLRVFLLESGTLCPLSAPYVKS